MASISDRVGDLGGYLREQREHARLSLRQLAQLAGVSNPYLSQVERGLRNPSAEVLQQLARGLQISAEALYVRAGILESEQKRPDVEAAVQADPELSDRQKRVLLDIYSAFRAENARFAAEAQAETEAVAVRSAPRRRSTPRATTRATARDAAEGAAEEEAQGESGARRPRRGTRTTRTTRAARTSAGEATATTPDDAAEAADGSAASGSGAGDVTPPSGAPARRRVPARRSRARSATGSDGDPTPGQAADGTGTTGEGGGTPSEGTAATPPTTTTSTDE